MSYFRVARAWQCLLPQHLLGSLTGMTFQKLGEEEMSSSGQQKLRKLWHMAGLEKHLRF